MGSKRPTIALVLAGIICFVCLSQAVLPPPRAASTRLHNINCAFLGQPLVLTNIALSNGDLYPILRSPSPRH
jgi:hypothetical protein